MNLITIEVIVGAPPQTAAPICQPPVHEWPQINGKTPRQSAADDLV